MKKKIILAVAFIVLLAGCGVGWWKYASERSDRLALAKELEAQKREMEIRQLVQGLRIPCEALFFDAETETQVEELRLKAWKKYGVTEFMRPETLDQLGAPPNERYWFGAPQSLDISCYYMGTLVRYWLNHGYYTTHKLAREYKTPCGLGGYLKQNPKVFNERIRPLLRRLLKGKYWAGCTKLDAAGILVASGDRSQKVRLALEELLQSKSKAISKGQVIEIMQQAGWESASPATQPAKNE